MNLTTHWLGLSALGAFAVAYAAVAAEERLHLRKSIPVLVAVAAVGRDSPRFVALASVNVVVAANAGGAFSPFGDITTLMVWQTGVVPFGDFFRLLLPSLVNWLVPAAIMSLAVEA